MAFIDELTIKVKSGNGGNGCDSYLRRADKKRIPNGGDGGDGGHIIISADSNMGSLLTLKSKRLFEGRHGTHGTSNNSYGRNGTDCVIRVPCGTTVFNKKDTLLIRDLVKSGEEVMVVRGGKRGAGNHGGRESTRGSMGAEMELFLSFKILCDICLVGFPNAGKTTLLKTLTGAGVQETDYPFSTRQPQLGTHQSDFKDIRICDLPSVYGASEAGGGLGTHHLKHLERTRLLFWVLEPHSEFASPEAGLQLISKLLNQMNPKWQAIPHFVVMNKADQLSKKEQNDVKLPEGERIYWISAKEGFGLAELMGDAISVLEQSHEARA